MRTYIVYHGKKHRINPYKITNKHYPKFKELINSLYMEFRDYDLKDEEVDKTHITHITDITCKVGDYIGFDSELNNRIIKNGEWLIQAVRRYPKDIFTLTFTNTEEEQIILKGKDMNDFKDYPLISEVIHELAVLMVQLSALSNGVKLSVLKQNRKERGWIGP